MKKIYIFLTILIVSCTNLTDSNLHLLNGYWEIESVTKDDIILKTYTFSNTIDYFELNELSGIRKKVMPRLNGTFMITQHEINFKIISTKNGIINIEYYDNNNTYEETIIKLNSNKLIITNSENYIYTYKPHEKFDLDE